MAETYWNHNTAYHPRILRRVRRRAEEPSTLKVLDVGSGDGFLVEKFAGLGCQVVGLDPDLHAHRRAVARLKGHRNVTFMNSDFLAAAESLGNFDLVCCVATLHHMKLREALRGLRDALRPGGELVVIGLSANDSWSDWAVAGVQLPIVRLLSSLHRETRDIGVKTTQPRETLSEIRAAVHEILPGATLRRRLYYRYELRWQR